MTAYGIVLMSYYVDRSQTTSSCYVALPALLTGALWLGLLLRAGAAVGRRRGPAAWRSRSRSPCSCRGRPGPRSPARFPRTALAHAAPGGSSLRAVARAPLAPAAAGARGAGRRARRCARYMPGERREPR